MAIKVTLDRILLERRMSLTDLSEKVGVTLANLSILKTGKAKAIRFSTLNALCRVLDCQPGELLSFEPSDTDALASTRAFYARLGYATCGRVPDYYADGDGKISSSADWRREGARRRSGASTCETRTQKAPSVDGAFGGADGTRTRGLRRDRPAL